MSQTWVRFACKLWGEVGQFSMQIYKVTPELISLDSKGAYRSKVEMMVTYLADKTYLAIFDTNETSEIASDQKNRVLKQSVLKSLMASAGLSDALEPVKTNVLITSSQLGQFINDCKNKRLQLEVLFQVSLHNSLQTKPVTQLCRILKTLGLSIQLADEKKIDGKKIRYYKIDQGSWTTVKHYAEKRMR